jgi:sulfofructose kinase
MSKVLVVGYNAWDTIIPLAQDPAADSKLEVARIISCGGGPAANAAFALARLGADVALATIFGDDEAGRQQRRDLQDAGVDLEFSRVAEGCETPRSCILVRPDDGSRRIIWSRGGLPAFAPADADPAWLQGVDLFYCDGHEAALSVRLAEAAKDLGLPAVMDAGTCRPGTTALAALCSDVISSTIFAPATTGEATPARALAALVNDRTRRVAMTFGSDGCLALDDGELCHVPAFAVDAVDTTGAGDLFHAGYAFARLQGMAFRAALEYGAAVAALKCRDYGGRTAAPTRAEVIDLIANGQRRKSRPNTGSGPAIS